MRISSLDLLMPRVTHCPPLSPGSSGLRPDGRLTPPTFAANRKSMAFLPSSHRRCTARDAFRQVVACANMHTCPERILLAARRIYQEAGLVLVTSEPHRSPGQS